MKTFAFIPARYASTRFPGKPLAPIAGKPMIQHVYERALACPELEGVYVATDDERISASVQEFGGKVIMTGKDHRSGTDRISEAARSVGLKHDDLIINIQGDQPLFHPSIVTQLIKPFEEDPSILMATLKCRIRDGEDMGNLNHVKVVTDNQGFAIYFSRLPIPFHRDGETGKVYYKHLGFYAFRMDFLQEFTRLPQGVLESAEKLEQLRALEHGFKIKVTETTFDSIEVDVPDDVRKVEALL
ncbi:MAG: 3-deoxy-manno-octulosonate cytidylyltransferase [Deltaproteobacteria bacterium]|nr:3-deoxy-manno-octulosonate cytidylyltransferase [Deltaproteobacteria bacterium]